jgi:hypothetical protein
MHTDENYTNSTNSEAQLAARGAGLRAVNSVDGSWATRGPRGVTRLSQHSQPPLVTQPRRYMHHQPTARSRVAPRSHTSARPHARGARLRPFYWCTQMATPAPHSLITRAPTRVCPLPLFRLRVRTDCESGNPCILLACASHPQSHSLSEATQHGLFSTGESPGNLIREF